MTGTPRRGLLAMAAGGMAAGWGLGTARAQLSEPLRIVATFPPGAALDGIGRLIAEAAPGAGLGTTVVDNRPGANGNIAAAQVARARPDGRTLLLSIDSTFTVNPHLYRDPGFDPAELEPVALAGTYPVVLLVHPSSGITDLPGFLAAARRQPLLYASAGNGSPGHLALAFLSHATGLPDGALEHVPFRGNAQAMTDLLAGRVQAGFIAISGGADFVRDGRLRALAISGPRRISMLPEVPTVAEAGHPGFDVRFAYLMLAPRGTPEPEREKVAALVRDVFARPDAQTRLAAWAVEPEAGGPAEAAAWIARARPIWGEVVQRAGMRVE